MKSSANRKVIKATKEIVWGKPPPSPQDVILNAFTADSVYTINQLSAVIGWERRRIDTIVNKLVDEKRLERGQRAGNRECFFRKPQSTPRK